ncbi:GNAT family N-acetyltransferase [Rhizobium yanglingense]
MICLTLLPSLYRAGLLGAITTLVVSQAARGQGLGRQLIEHGESWLHERGAVNVVVNRSNYRQAARRLYETAGFSGTGVRFTKSLAGEVTRGRQPTSSRMTPSIQVERPEAALSAVHPIVATPDYAEPAHGTSRRCCRTVGTCSSDPASTYSDLPQFFERHLVPTRDRAAVCTLAVI